MTSQIKTDGSVKKEFITKLNNFCYQNKSTVQKTKEEKEEKEANDRLRAKLQNYKKQNAIKN